MVRVMDRLTSPRNWLILRAVMRWHNARMQRVRLAAMLCLLAIGMAGPEPVRAEPGTETVEEAICRLVEASAAATWAFA